MANKSIFEMANQYQQRNAIEHADIEKFQKYSELCALSAVLQREFKHELSEYDLNKQIVNLVTDMGFIIQNERLNDQAGVGPNQA